MKCQAKAKERIQDTDQKILAESESCKKLTEEHDAELAATRVSNGESVVLRVGKIRLSFTSGLEAGIRVTSHIFVLLIFQQVRDLVEETAKQVKNYEHDTEHIKLQLKDKMHDVEKVLQQGKLVTMGEVKSEIKERYKVCALLPQK